MRTPTEFELQKLMHSYDAQKAHAYYERTKKLKGRKKGSGGQATTISLKAKPAPSPAKARQRKELRMRIMDLQKKLGQLEALIRKKEHEEKATDRKSKAKKERAAKERDKPKTAAEKAQIARDNKKYRDKNQQKLKTKSHETSGKSSGSSEKKDTKSEPSVADLKTLATKVKGQIAVATQKLAAL